MSALADTVGTVAPVELGERPRRFEPTKVISGWPPVVAPLAVAILNAAAFYVLRPNVGDLQAALARQSAAAHGVGLTYWFTWFGGGATPGTYSVLTPYLSALIGGAVLVGVLATITIPPLAYRALVGTQYRIAGTWIATVTTGFNIWSGRIPFALGSAVALVALIAVRERRVMVAVLGTIVSGLCSPVTGAFLAFGLGAAFLVEREFRKLIALICATCAVTLIFVAVVFGNPGPQGYAVGSCLLTSFTALAMLRARPIPSVRVVLWCTALAAPVLAIFPNGLGSNFVRLPWIWLPVVVVATASARRLVTVLAVFPALALCANATIVDLVHSSRPGASKSYYDSLITQLTVLPSLQNYRVEVVEDPQIHTAAYALLGHAALAGGYETQEQNHLNGILKDPARLDQISYKVWLENNAVGYVAFNRLDGDGPEYSLVKATKLGYLHEVSRDSRWTLYRVENPTPIVPAPEVLLSATQAEMRIVVPCACTFAVRVRYSRYLGAVSELGHRAAVLSNDGAGWTVVVTPASGTYVVNGDFTRPLH